MLLPVQQPNAEAQFLEVKNAFQVLSDPQQRAEYDRKLRWVSGRGWLSRPCVQHAALERGMAAVCWQHGALKRAAIHQHTLGRVKASMRHSLRFIRLGVG